MNNGRKIANFVKKNPFDLNIFLSHMKYGRKIKNPLLNRRSSPETGKSNFAEDLLFFCDGSETALTSRKCEVKEHILVIESGAPRMFCTVLCSSTLSKKLNAK